MSDEPKPCEFCGGDGVSVVRENLVTPDMASDAGYPEMAGMHHSYDYEPCEYCEGTGHATQQSTNSEEEE